MCPRTLNWKRPAESLQKFFAQAIKAAVGHDEKKVTRFDFDPKMLDDGVRTGKHAGVLAEGTHTFRNGLGVKAILAIQLLSAKNAAENDPVADGERPRQRLLKHFAAHGIGPRLENGPQPAPWPAPPRPLDR